MEAKLALGQKQTLTAAMRTSVHILQLGALQLQDYVQELMSSNVVVELNAADVPSGIDWYMPRRAASSHGGRTDRLPPARNAPLLSIHGTSTFRLPLRAWTARKSGC